MMVQVMSEPTLVQETRVNLRVVGQPENPIPAGDLTVNFDEMPIGQGWIKITPPDEI